MTGTDGVKIMLLHHSEICRKLFYVDGETSDRIGVMPIDAVEFYLLPVQEEDVILNLNGSEAYVIRDSFVLRLDDKRI